MYRKLKGFEQERRTQTTSSTIVERFRFWRKEKDRKVCLKALRTWNKNLLCLTDEARREPVSKRLLLRVINVLLRNSGKSQGPYTKPLRATGGVLARRSIKLNSVLDPRNPTRKRKRPLISNFYFGQMFWERQIRRRGWRVTFFLDLQRICASTNVLVSTGSAMRCAKV